MRARPACSPNNWRCRRRRRNLRRLGAGRIADAFVETRLAGQWRNTYGMLDSRHDARMIIDTLYPPVN